MTTSLIRLSYINSNPADGRHMCSCVLSCVPFIRDAVNIWDCISFINVLLRSCMKAALVLVHSRTHLCGGKTRTWLKTCGTNMQLRWFNATITQKRTAFFDFCHNFCFNWRVNRNKTQRASESNYSATAPKDNADAVFSRNHNLGIAKAKPIWRWKHIINLQTCVLGLFLSRRVRL